LKDYAAPWQGEVIFACKRCQKRLRHHKHPSPISHLRRWLKDRKSESHSAIHLIEIPCQNICPKKGIVAFGRAQLASRRPRFAIVSTEKQLERFCQFATRSIARTKAG
jgi:predicted metal-binding protein